MSEVERRARFDEFVRQVGEPVRRYLARRTDPDTAEDVFADTLLVCWRRLDDVPADPLPWTYVVARNCLANAERTRRRGTRLFEKLRVVDPPRPVPGPGEEPDAAPVHEALARLRQADAEILRLWAWEGLGPADLATVLAITENAAAIRLHRARRRLRDELGKTVTTSGHIEAEGRTGQ